MARKSKGSSAPKPPKGNFKSAKTGQFVPAKYAKTHPATTYKLGK